MRAFVSAVLLGLVLVGTSGCAEFFNGLDANALTDLTRGAIQSVPSPRPICPPGVDPKAVTWCRVETEAR